jgi:hypothetical protein
MATRLCQKCKESHPDRVCDYGEKVNAPRRLQLKRLPDRITSDTKTRKIEVRYDCGKWSLRSSGRKSHRLNIDSNESSLMRLAGAIQ